MRLLRIAPAAALLLVAYGCGVNRQLSAPTATPGGTTGATGTAATVAGAAAAAAAHDGPAGDDGYRGPGGFVYTLGNDAGGNQVLAYSRRPDGSLAGPVATPTGGHGSGASLGSQGSVAVAPELGLLFAVDAGSNDIATLRITGAGLRAIGTTPSGGTVPVSLTQHGDLLFVLDDGGNGSIAGFRIGRDGRLSAIPGAASGLGNSGGAPAEVSFTPDGDHLVVTEKAANAIVVFDVGRGGALSAPHVQPSAGATPYGFAFGRSGTLVVSEAAGGAANASSASSYHVGFGAHLEVVTASAPTHQTAACWVAVPAGGEFAYTTNAGSNSITGYRVGRDGALSLVDASGVSATADGTPVDAAFDGGGRFLYVLNGTAHTLNAYRRGPDGTLAPMTGVSGLPATSVGLAAF